jgi:hypothetical protein
MVKTTKKKTDKLTVAPEDMSKVLKGNHLTVTTDAKGKVTLQWDWDALMQEVVAATGLVVEEKPKTKKKTKK